MKKSILTIILCIIACGIGVLLGYFIFNQPNNNKTNEQNYNKVEENNVNESNKDDNEVTNNDTNTLEQLKGVWGYCLNNNINAGCYLTIIEANGNTYSYRSAQYQTDGSLNGTIKNIQSTTENKYEIEVYVEGYESPISSHPEATYYHNIDISDINNDIIYIDGNEYEYITDKYSSNVIETYFNNKSNG